MGAIALWCTVSLLVEVAIANQNDDTISVPGFLGRPSTETQVINITANGVHFAVPRNYLYSAALRPNYGVFFQIVAALPGFAGASPMNIEQFRGSDWWKYPNTITLGRSIGDANRNRNTLEGAAEGELQDADFGLLLAKRWPFRDVFVNFNEHAVIECDISRTPDTGLSFPKRCRVWITVADRVTFQCEYLREQLKNWRAINDGVNLLLDRFRTGGAQR